MQFEEHELQLEDNKFDFGIIQKDVTFLRLSEEMERFHDAEIEKNTLNRAFIFLNPRKVLHKRSVYTFFDLLGDIGGL